MALFILLSIQRDSLKYFDPGDFLETVKSINKDKKSFDKLALPKIINHQFVVFL